MIAVLTNNKTETFRWIKDQFKIATISVSNWHIELLDGRDLRLVSSQDDIVGLIFTDIIKSPQYETLEDQVKMRIR